MIELELLADDFDDSENFQGENYDDDEEWDYEFDDDDEEEEEDIADELLYGGGKAKIIGSDEKIEQYVMGSNYKSKKKQTCCH